MLTLGRSRSPMLVLAGMVGTALLLVLLAMGAAEEAGLMGASGTAPLARAGLPRPSAAPQPVAELSSRFSSTYRLADGTLSTHLSSRPVNFRDARGRWRAIDSRLVARGDAFANRAGAHAVSLPRRLSQGIRVGAGRDRLSMRLVGADGAVAVRGAQARYRDVLPAVSAIYDSEATGLRERLVLADRTAPARLVFSLNASRGLQPRQQANGDVVFSRNGRTAFVLPAPFAYAQGKDNETHPVSSVLRRQHDRWTLTVAGDRGWVHDTLGHGPVVIDPTVEIDPDSQDCFIESDTPTTNYCSDTHLSVGYDGVNDQRGLVQFDLSALPKDAVILNADVGLTLGGHSTNNTKQVGVYRVLQPWTNSATWNKYDATHSWATAGAAGSADASSTAAAVVTTGTGSGFVDWYPTRLVQDWVSGAVPNYGFLIRDVNPNTTANELDFHQREGGSVTPELDIVWSERTGLSDNYDFDGQALDGKTDIAVNVANGNLFVDTRGLSAPGNGLDLELQNYHNSLASPTELQGEGIRGTASLGGDVRLKVFDPTTVAFFRGDGLNASFLSPTVSGTTATYITPPEFGNATLTRDTSTNVYTLNLPNGAPAWPDVDLTMTFAPSGTLTSVKDAAGHAISLSYFSGGGQELPGLSGITDTNGASFTLEPNPAGDSYISDVTDPAGHHWSYVYGHDNTDYLTTYTAGDTGQTWHYDYDSSHRLTSVTTPDGKVTKITYVGTTSKTASIMVTTDAAHTTGPTTTYAYSEPSAPCDPANGDIGKTVVTPPSGPAVTYCHDAQDQITYDDRVTGDADASCDTSTPVDDGEGPVDCSAPEPDLSVWPSLDPDAPHDPAPQGLAAAAATPPVPTRFAWAFSDQNPEFLQQPGTPPSVVARMIPQSPNDLPIVRLTVPYNAVSDAPTTDPGDPCPGGGSVHKAHLRYVRLQRVKAWITAAYAAHKRVLISFEHCATVTPGANAAAQSQPDDQDAGWCAKPENRPTTRAYHDAVKAFLTYNPAGGPDFRQIEFFTAWNEPNHSKTQPTGGTDPHDVDENHRHDVNVTNSGAFQAGEYFYTLDHMCRAFYGCTVGAGDFSDFDLPNAIASKYLTEYKLGMRRNPPAFWAWHAYKDTLQAITTPTSAHWSILKKFLRATEIRSRTPAKQPPVMITEVGITYAASTGRSDQVGNNDDRANLGMQRLMTEAPVAHTTDPRTRGRIKSLFYYALRGALAPDGTQHAFDSGLISPANNHVRPMWQTWCNTVTGATCDTSLVGQDAGPRDQNLYP